MKRALVQKLEDLARAGLVEIPHGQILECRVARAELSVEPTTESDGAQTTASIEQNTPSGPVLLTDSPVDTPPIHSESPQETMSKKRNTPSVAKRQEALNVLAEEVTHCFQCAELSGQRNKTVFGVGNPAARLCFFGEGPGADEDRQGEPFVGRAGQLLDKIIAACTLTREEVYILNVVKCRPPGNRNPATDEIANCRPYFERQLEIIQPEFIVCLGSVAASTLLETTVPIGRLRGKFHDWRNSRVVATYHPAYLLRNPAAKADVWTDMQMLMKAMGIPLPKKSG
ncbi:MAG: uracil-DNA glycosylase [Planctomycetales bacterium]|nr:uracil-DNA glycosylase [Planctomycetales bacterium]